MKTKSHTGSSVEVITMGCSKNLVDSENIITQLRSHQIDAEHENGSTTADVIIVNTCGFIESAKQESIDTILKYAGMRSSGAIEKLYVTGCLSHRYSSELEREIPEVDGFFGTLDMPALLARFNVDYQHELLGARQIATPPHYAYLKISEGCNRTCSFCAIPLMRGKHRSKPMEDIIKEARNLASLGVREIMLIAQELTYYGLDIYKDRKLSPLLKELCRIEGIEWIRLHYAYPSKFPLDILHTMAAEPKICNYLDMPLQHASDHILNRMRRQISKSETTELLQQVRQTVPGVAIRTTFMVGFPGETEEDFLELCEFVREHRFDRLGVFQYSHEEGTSAHELNDEIPSELKEERAKKLIEIQQKISFDKNQDFIGRQMKILIDRKEGDYFIGRTEYDSPEVDNEVLIDARDHYLRIGDFSELTIFDAESYDLFAGLKS